MALWNSGAIWNRKGKEGGFTWNSRYYLFVVRLNDTMRAVDGLSELSAKLILQDSKNSFYDVLVNSAFYGNINEEFRFEEDTKVSLLFALAEELGVKDELTDYIVNLFLSDDIKGLEEIKLLASLLIDDDVSAIDETYVRAFQSLRDAYLLEDVKAESLVWLYLHDRFGLSDHDKPRTAESDWLIGVEDGLDRAYDYFLPLYINANENNILAEDRKIGMRVSWKDSELAVMPEQENTTVQISGVDGELIAGTRYKSRLFELALFSDDHLSIAQKEDLKRRITQVLDTSKKNSRKLTVQSRGITFDAKYQNSSIKDGPSFVRCDLSVLVPPYAKDMFPNELRTNGLIDNSEGLAPLSPKITITGSVSNPYFQIGAVTYRYNGTVPSNKRLIIDFERYTACIEDNFQNRENALKNFTGEFHSIPAGSSEVLTISPNLQGKFLAEWKIALLW